MLCIISIAIFYIALFGSFNRLKNISTGISWLSASLFCTVNYFHYISILSFTNSFYFRLEPPVTASTISLLLLPAKKRKKLFSWKSSAFEFWPKDLIKPFTHLPITINWLSFVWVWVLKNDWSNLAQDEKRKSQRAQRKLTLLLTSPSVQSLIPWHHLLILPKSQKFSSVAKFSF